MTFDWAKLLAPLLAAVVAFGASVIAGTLAYAAAVANNRKNLLVNTVTKERADWRRDLRNAVGALSKAAYVVLADPLQPLSAEHIGAFHDQRIAIKLRLNPSNEKRHDLDQAILLALTGLSVAVSNRCRAEAEVELFKIEDAVQALLKREWEVSKAEAQTGVLHVESWLTAFRAASPTHP